MPLAGIDLITEGITTTHFSSKKLYLYPGAGIDLITEGITTSFLFTLK